jgi:outer membrane protein assembly factor BamB
MRRTAGVQKGMNRRALVTVGVVILVVLGASAAYGGSTWPTAAGNSQRTANDTSEPNLRPLHSAWTRPLDAGVYAQPLVANGRVYSATQNNTVYALDAHDGAILWKRHLGTPMTNVSAQVGCGNVDPLGILSTPVIDTGSNTIYVVATVQDSFRHIHHQLIGLNAITGIPRVSVNADPGDGQDPLYNQQRAGLALANGRVYIGYGGYAGDCGPYHGWLVSISTSGAGKVAFNVTPNGGPAGAGAIWAPGGVSVDGGGNVYAATGNPDPTIAGDFGESVVKFDSTAGMHRTGATKTFPGGDRDISSVSPSILPNHLLFQIGKQQLGLLIDTRNMHIVSSLAMCAGAEADGANAWDGSHLYVPCNNGIQQVNVNLAARTMALGWKGPGKSAPLLAAGAVWSVDWSHALLYALDRNTGAVLSGFPIAIPATPHFAAPSAALGLVLVGTNSGVSAYAGPSGVPPHAPGSCVTQKNHNGYWVASSDGNVFPFGGAPSCGSLADIPLAQPIVGIAGLRTPGYWMVARDGGIFSFGKAKFHGSMGGHHLNQPIVVMTATSSAKGYWMVASDGGIFTFGDAKFRGSMGGSHLNQPIVGMATTPSGKGYWMVASDGGIFTFGDATFRGSMGGSHLNRPVVGMASTPSGDGYYLVASDGGIFTFGDAKFRGSTGNIRLASPIVGMTRDGKTGYWFVAGDGGVFSFNAPFHGSAVGLASGAAVVGMAHD